MSKRRCLVAILVACVTVLGGGVGVAVPALLGGTGIVSVPNAMVAPTGQVQTALAYQRLQGLSNTLSMYNGSETLFRDEAASLWGIQALAAVANGAELWATYSKDNSDAGMKTWGFGGKYQFPAADEKVCVALGTSYRRGSGSLLTGTFRVFHVTDILFVGTLDITPAPEETNYDVYLAATADLTAAGLSDYCGGGRVLATAGVLYKRIKLDADAEMVSFNADGVFLDRSSETLHFVDDSLVRPFLAIEWAGPGCTSAGIEYRWKDSSLDFRSVLSAVVRHEFAGGFTGQFGVTNCDQFGVGLDDQNWFAMVGYDFGRCK